jgi:hypothetical protein
VSIRSGHANHHAVLLAITLMLVLAFAPGVVSQVPSLVGAYAWDIETVDSDVGTYGGHTSLALDDGGYPHASYYDASDGTLKHAYKDTTGWQIETVDTGLGTVSSYVHTSLALDTDGYPHLSYKRSVEVRYAHQDANGWHIETVDSDVSLVGGFSSLVMDEQDHPHISYYDGQYGQPDSLKYARKDVSGWHVETVDDTLSWDASPYTSLALDGNGYPHIGYCDSLGGSSGYFQIKYAYEDADGWHIETVDSGGATYGNSYVSLALDMNGYAHISYCHRDDDDLKYAYKDDGGWHVETVDSEGNVGYYASLVLDAGGCPHISYSGSLKYAHKDASGWHIQVVDSPGSFHTSLALGADGHPHICYEQSDTIQYASSWEVTGLAYLPLIARQPTPTPTPTPTMTPTPRPSPTPGGIIPVPGTWRNDPGYFYVRFNVTSDGRVGNAQASTDCGTLRITSYVEIGADGSWLLEKPNLGFISGQFTSERKAEGQSFYWDGIWGHCIDRQEWTASP